MYDHASKSPSSDGTSAYLRMSMEASSLTMDYLVFVAYIAASFVIPLWGKFKARKKETKADYVFATGTVSMGAMMLSIARGTLGVRSFLGYPSELYFKGSAMWETLYGMLLSYPIVCFVFVPVYYSLGITSVYQYLDMRFNSRLVRCLASFSYVIRSLLNLGVAVFTPCVALYTVIGLPYWASIIGITTVSVALTVMGSLKAAITSDVIQGLTMIGVSIMIIIHGTIDAGGVSNVFNVSKVHERLEFFNFDMDPTIRVTTISATLGQFFMSLSVFGCQQNFVQRYCSMSSRGSVVKTMMANMPVITVLFSLSWVVGMVIFANYVDCDPYTKGFISKFDEIVPFYVEDKFVYLPGFLGLVMATLFNSALTLAVSNLQSLATVTFEDFLSQLPAFSNLKDTKQLRLIKVIGIIYGLLIIGISFLVGMLPGVIESSMLMTSATSGPLLGVFVLAMLVPCANWKGASAGMILSHMIILWLTFGRLMLDLPVEKLPLSIDGCRNDTFSPHVMRPATKWTEKAQFEIAGEASNSPLQQVYGITYMYYALIGSLTTVLVGIIVSLLTADPKSDVYEEHLLHPAALKLSKLFPGRPRIYSGSTRLADEGNNAKGENTPVTSIPNGNSKLKTQIDECGKNSEDSYIEKLDALKRVSLQVTNEISKGTRL